MISVGNALSNIDWDFPHSERKDSIHNIHPYPAKFIPEIPRMLINTIGLPQGTCVLDPFCGSGATLVESQLAGFSAIGIDLNPIACLISRVKSQPLSEDFIPQIKTVITKAKACQGIVAVPPIPNLDHWFMKELQWAIASLVLQIEDVPDQNTKEALNLALSSILVRVSNQESDTRYAAIEKKLTADTVFSLFQAASERIWEAKAECDPPRWDVEVMNKDILNVQPSDIRLPVGLVITSPPYPNAYEYWLYHKYRMYWLGYDPLAVKEHEIGARAHYFKKRHPTEDDFRQQMTHLVRLLYQVVVFSGHICVVIGRSKVHGQIIDNASIVADVGQENGFRLLARLPRTIAPSRKTFNLTHANIKTEEILVFEKPL